jgi:GDPmannose 4,6-dehydratase
LQSIIEKIQPDEIYNLAAQSQVQISFEIPEYTTQVNAVGVLNLLNIIKNSQKKIKFYQASTSEMFGSQNKMPLYEKSKMDPASPYGVAKLYAYNLVRNYRDSYNIFAANGILFNHESPLRGENFVTRKITIGISEIFHGYKKILEIGNFNSKRDWGHARDYAEAIYRILQHRKPLDLVIATNKSYSIKDFIKDSEYFKSHLLPLARIKKIMKSDEDVRMISAETPVLFAKACEMFIIELTLRSWFFTE